MDEGLRIDAPDGKGGVSSEDVSIRRAMNEVTRALYARDCDVGVQRWNRHAAESGRDVRFRLPSARLRRSIGVWAATRTDPEGQPIDDDAWQARQRDWLPSAEDRGFVNSLMRCVTEPGKVAGWIAPPKIGINNEPSTTSMCG
jgi:benzoyl-CoA 2,3-dioxygenase component B